MYPKRSVEQIRTMKNREDEPSGGRWRGERCLQGETSANKSTGRETEGERKRKHPATGLLKNRVRFDTHSAPRPIGAEGEGKNILRSIFTFRTYPIGVRMYPRDSESESAPHPPTSKKKVLWYNLE
jgi:hypothetical protein